jgi:hypothetical protein
MTRLLGLVAGAIVLFVVVVGTRASDESGPLSGTFVDWADHPAIRYHGDAPNDPVADLSRRLQNKDVQLTREGRSGYLRSVLDALHVSVDSQMMVFEPDSVQAGRISPGNPRALFFNDEVAVGWVRGGFIELAAQDPRQGVVFYSLTQSLTGAPSITRHNECVTCHYSYASSGVPGMLVRSARQFAVTHRVPFEKRWGGWYVTGQHSTLTHLGNTDLQHLYDDPRPSGTSNWASLDGKFDTTGYLAPYSDIVALMVFEHQMHMMNLLTRIGWEARVAEYRERTPVNARAAGDDPADKTVPLDEAAQEVVDYMLLVDEAPLAQPIRGSTTFSTRFSAQGPRDSRGRSLRQLDLEHRLLRYRCSYMIYSRQFEQLPASAKSAIYRRLWDVLSGRQRGDTYSRLSRADRAAVVEILHDTKSDLPAYFSSASVH